jgi:hypothetical protein
MEKQELAILFSGGSDSLSLYALAAVGAHPQIPRPRRIHLLHMLNGMGCFPFFPKERFRVSEGILKAHRFPQFAEDVVRETAKEVGKRFCGKLPALSVYDRRTRTPTDQFRTGIWRRVRFLFALGEGGGIMFQDFSSCPKSLRVNSFLCSLLWQRASGRRGVLTLLHL